jgi:hypothetical protein
MKTVVLIISFCTSNLYPMPGINRILTTFNKPAHIPTYINHSNRITLERQKNERPIILTANLRGCFVTVIYLKKQDEQHVIMTHVHPAELMQHRAHLEEEIIHIPYQQDNYAHAMLIYFNGKSFLAHESGKIEAYKTSKFSDKAAQFSEQTCVALEQLIREKLLVNDLVVSHIPYVLAPTLNKSSKGTFEGESAEIEVVLSYDTDKPSYCKIYDASERTIYCDTRLDKATEYAKNAEERAQLTYIRVCNTE